jgi:intracellular sulfur oxidation DsrE/DsrF family protein
MVFHVDDNDPKRMNLVLNNVANVNNYYQGKGEQAQIEIVAYKTIVLWEQHLLRTAKLKE